MEGDPVDKLRIVFIRPDGILHRDQIRVINVLRGESKCKSIDAAQALIARVGLDNYNAISKYIAESAPAIVHVSPRVCGLLLKDGILRSIFEIQKKGEIYLEARIGWEAECFHKLYNKVEGPERPKYGALNYLNSPAGIPAALMYGGWHFTLKNSMRHRITIASGDTAGSRNLGVLDFCAHILQDLSDTELKLLIGIARGYSHHAPYPPESQYRELQIHGDVRLDRDIESLHLPRNELNDTAKKISAQYGIKLVPY